MTRTKLLAITAAALIALTACGGDDGGDDSADGGDSGTTADQGFTPPDLKALDASLIDVKAHLTRRGIDCRAASAEGANV